jgi:metal-dependent amidase/aminoacylase/carboxypeptidase family protein
VRFLPALGLLLLIVSSHSIAQVGSNPWSPTPADVDAIYPDIEALYIDLHQHRKTGLPFASTVVAKNAAGETIPVMHACGHDLHMAAWAGTARLMAGHRDRWSGTLVLVGQPAEEGGAGAKAMLSGRRCSTSGRWIRAG